MKITKVLLVHSGHYDSRGNLVHARGWRGRLSIANVAKLSLPLLAAYTPPGIEVELVEEYFAPVPFDTAAEVVAIHAQVMQHDRALDLAAEFKKRGKIVLMGGFLPSMNPEAVQSSVDALCIGDGDQVWAQMLADIEAGCLRKIYRGDPRASLERVPIPRYDLIKRDRPVVYPVQATRGCPYRCTYCSIVEFHAHTYRYRPIDDIIRDIKVIPSKQIYFCDDNLMENPEFAKELFHKMEGLGVEWGTQTSITAAEDRTLLEAAYRVGCRFVAVGVESLSQESLHNVGKEMNDAAKYAELFRAVQETGIAVHALLVFGLPEDTVDTFERTVEFLEQQNVGIAEFFLFTPYPGTPAGEQALREGIITDRNLSHYRETYLVFAHPRLAPEQILAHYWEAYDRIYSLRSIARRIARGRFKNKLYHTLMNLYYWAKVKRRIVPVYFGRGN